MEDNLEQQLLNIASPEETAMFIKLTDLLDEVGVTTHIDTIEQNMGITDYPTGGEFLNMFRDTLERQLTYELGIFSIKLNPDTPYDMALYTEILRGLYYLDSYKDPEALLVALESEDDPRESLFKVLSIVNPIDEDDFFLHVEDVSIALLTRLKSLKETLPDAVSEAVAALRGMVINRTRYVRNELLPMYTEFEGERNSEVLMHIENVQLGFDLAPTAGLLVQRIFQQEMKEVIADLGLLAVASNLSSPSRGYDILVENYIPDEEVVKHVSLINQVRTVLITAEGLPNE